MGGARHAGDLGLVQTFPFPFNPNLAPWFFPQRNSVSLQFLLVRIPTFICETRVIFRDDDDRISSPTTLTITLSICIFHRVFGLVGTPVLEENSERRQKLGSYAYPD